MAPRKNYNELFNELYALLRKHNIEFFDCMVYFKNDKYYRQSRGIHEFEHSPSEKDTQDTDDLIYRVMIDWALDNGMKNCLSCSREGKTKLARVERDRHNCLSIFLEY